MFNLIKAAIVRSNANKPAVVVNKEVAPAPKWDVNRTEVKTGYNGYGIVLQKKPFHTVTIIVTDDDNGVQDSVSLAYDKRFLNIAAARDAGVFDVAINKVIEGLKTLTNQ